MDLRPADRADYPAVEAIWREQNRLHADLEPEIIARANPVMSRQGFLEILDDPLQEIAVAFEGRSVVGAALLVERHLRGELQVPRSVAFVQEICILGSHRRRGVGRRLLAYVEVWGRARGLGSIELNVWAKNAAALAFYEALGFETLRYELRRPL